MIDAVNEGDVGAFTEKTVTFENTDYITFGNRGFIGLEGYNIYTILRNVTNTIMNLSIFMHSVMAATDKPSHLNTLSFDAK